MKRVPVFIAFGVMLLTALARWSEFDLLERIELMTYDLRARQALKFPALTATNLGFVFIDEATVARVRDGSLGYRYGLYWPRQVYGRLVEELAAQGAKRVAFDVIFGELRPDHPPVQMQDGRLLESDEFFALQMRRASNVVLAVTRDLYPPALFATNAVGLGDISTDKDTDGILRRVRAFRMYRQWHPAFLQVEADPSYGVDLRQARLEHSAIVLPRARAEAIRVPLDMEGQFDVADFWGEKLPPGTAHKARPYTEERVWHLGVVLAAAGLGLDLSQAEVDLPHGRIVLRGPGVERILPVDAEGNSWIDWALPPNHPGLTQQGMHDLLEQDRLRLEGHAQGLTNLWRGKLVVIGSSALANDLTDRGATPLRADTLLVSKHWNVANSILTGRFVRRTPLWVDLLVILVLGSVSALLTWQCRALWAFPLVLLVSALYILLGVVLYVQTRCWIPLVLPVLGACVMEHLCLLSWQVGFEQAERRRMKSIFSRVVSPKIVQELLSAEALSLGGARREVTVLFTDVRGFTELTDASQERAADIVRQQRLAGPEAEACFAEHAREILEAVNLYLGLVAEIVKGQDGTLDKFIGDCVMAFWGAPTPNPRHAVACVRSAIEAQRSIFELNRQRAQANQARETENRRRVAASLPPKPLLPILTLGSGVNTGVATAGLMGSTRAGSYTVFGREVNLASRLESASGPGRIHISETTYQHLLRDDPALAASCQALEPLQAKGFRHPIKVYEVPWQLTTVAPWIAGARREPQLADLDLRQ